MEKRFVAAFALSVLILLGWSLLSKRYFPTEPAPVPASLPAPVVPPAPADSVPETAEAQRPAPVAPPASGVAPVASTNEEEVRLETDVAEIILTNKGGRVRSWKLKQFKSNGSAVDFVSIAARRDDLLPLALVFDDRAILPGINAALFTVSREDDASGGMHVSFRWSDGAGSEVEKAFVFHKGEPLVELSVKAIDRARTVTPRLSWGPGFEVEDPKHRSNTYYHGQALIYDGVQVTRYAKRKIDTTISIPETPRLQWAGLEDQYFTALLLPAASRGAVTIAPFPQSAFAIPGKTVPEDLASAPVIAISIPEGKAQLFVGPKNFGLLQSLGHGLEQAVWFSSYKAIYVCAKPVFLALRFVHDHWVANYGVAIILLTVGLRVLLFPLNQFSMVKMRRVAGDMQRVQPKLKAIQAKYKKSKDPESRAKLNAETMELYKREGVNPFGGVSGCLPLLIQMPILCPPRHALRARAHRRGTRLDRTPRVEERMRRYPRRAHVVECGRELCLARHRAFHLVPERPARAVRGKFSEAREISRGERRGGAGLGDGGLSVEFARGVSGGVSKCAREGTARAAF